MQQTKEPKMMNTITIDSQLYMAAERYAAARHISVEELIERSIKQIVGFTQKTKVSYKEDMEFKKASAYLDTLSVKDFVRPVPADENGLDALIEDKYEV